MSINKYDRLEGMNICLRKARESDSDSMLRHVWGDEDVYRWMLYAPTFGADEALERCRRSIEYQKDHFAYFISLKDTDEAFGMCAIRGDPEGHFEESGICIGKQYQGRGYGRETVALLLDLAFCKLGAEDFRYGYFEDNTRSGKLAEHFGFRYEKTYAMTREWDNSVKTIRSCILTRKEYMAQLSDKTDVHCQGKMRKE